MVALAALAVVAGVVLNRVARAPGAVIVTMAVVVVSTAGVGSVDAATNCPPTTSTAVAPVAPSTSTTTTTPAPIVGEVSIRFSLLGSVACQSWLVLSGWAPYAPYVVEVTHDSDLGPVHAPRQTPMLTDDLGNATLPTSAYPNTNGINEVLTATVNGVSSGPVPIAC